MNSDDRAPTGYGKPPAEHQFQHGQSGNPKGRRKGALNTNTIVQAIATERHRVTIEGRPRTMNTVELLVQILKHRSLQGSVKANKLLDKYRIRFAPEPTDTPKYAVFPEALTIEEWMELYSPKDDVPYGYGGEALTPRF
ncbi:hypothetical protein SAMN02745157_3711 [Kaistia soli DSM 19436]|uniref:DUF5681 domain-containing protein n=1 Tax=Kaistia soli DSM 19436 TaxID=1122133 RepID=A0A1M5I2H6_9HYPH|nr:DUF5681 domain-containing protein [Kaistia soli]SHG22193.1 hypothetical protein SAMN02745157_3711 [Kaistia soli DSM 19436]